MNNQHQHIDQQVEFVRRELTRISQEVIYLEGTQLQALRVRQSRLEAELERLEAHRHSGAFSVSGWTANAPWVRVGNSA